MVPRYLRVVWDILESHGLPKSKIKFSEKARQKKVTEETPTTKENNRKRVRKTLTRHKDAMEAHKEAGDSTEVVGKVKKVVGGSGVPWRLWQSLENVAWGRRLRLGLRISSYETK